MASWHWQKNKWLSSSTCAYKNPPKKCRPFKSKIYTLIYIFGKKRYEDKKKQCITPRAISNDVRSHIPMTFLQKANTESRTKETIINATIGTKLIILTWNFVKRTELGSFVFHILYFHTPSGVERWKRKSNWN